MVAFRLILAMALMAASSAVAAYAQFQHPSGQPSQVLIAQEDRHAESTDGDSAELLTPMPPTELDFTVDEKIKVKVEPFVSGSLVDRIVEPTTVSVVYPGAAEIDLFVVAVDSPYGGKALEKPRLIGKDAKPGDGFKIQWNNKEPDPYVKIFAVVKKKSGDKRFRSRTLDFGMAGARFEPKKLPQ